MTTDKTSQPYLFELLARKSVVVWADSAEEAAETINEHLMDSGDWVGVQAEGGQSPISEADAANEIRHGAIEDKP
ncbi:MAG: hypothetical protein GAK28_03183 [Luteibacter sp.]|uniref:hypothetical protein n=1 Tax=Luteibacter sp. TaxID=1886636 RepID=UPI00138404BB|nr:hypothetical protein [Luteibacter sp.]KAF1005431.1 MAG: hypothetical protein GAK28_03183 [Luteibacter sp.]